LSSTGEDVVPFRQNGRPAFLVNRPDHAEHVLARNEANYANPYHPYKELAGAYTPAGSFLLRLQHGSGAAAMESVVDDLAAVTRAAAAQLVRRSERDAVDVDLAMKTLMMRADVRILFGVDFDDGACEEFARAVGFIEECGANGLFTGGAAPPDAELTARYDGAVAGQNRIADELARRAGLVPGAQADAQALRVALVRTLLNSYNATATALAWVLWNAARRPGVLARLCAENDGAVGARAPSASDLPKLSYARAVILETLRLYPPAWIVARVARAPDRLGAWTIPPGAVVSVSPYTMQRLASLWERPREFVPERFAAGPSAAPARYAYFPFGGGARRCPAAWLAVNEIQIVLATLLGRCRLEDASPAQLRPRGLVALRPDPGVRMRFSERV
jgi:cytochrome P450